MKLFKKIIALVLTAAMFYEGNLLCSIEAFAQGDKAEKANSEIISTLAEYNDKKELVDTGWYISDVMVAYGGTLLEAEKKIEDAGYLPYPQDTNDTGAGLATCIGYKVTQDKSQAITSLALMNQNGGYSEFDYEEYLNTKFEDYNFPGLDYMIQGMKAACDQMRNNIKNGSKAASIALKYLNLYHVPGDEADTPELRIPLGTYLIDGKRTNDDYKKVLLVSDTPILSFICSHIGAGCNDSYVSTNQKVLCAGSVENPTWLQDAFDAVLNNEYLFCIEDDSLNEYWLYLMDDCYAEAIRLINNLENDTLSNQAMNYLSGIKNTAGEDGEPKEICGETYTDLLDFLKKACTSYDEDVSARLLYAFVNALPQGLSTQYFVEIVNSFCENGDGKLPKYYSKTPEIESKWMMKAMEKLRDPSYDPNNPNSKFESENAERGYEPDNPVWVEKKLKGCEGYRDKIELFVSMIEQFAGEYDKACETFGDLYGVYTDVLFEEDKKAVYDQARALAAQGEDISEETLADELVAMGAYTHLAQYNIISKKTVLDGYRFPPGYVSWECLDEPETNEPQNLGEYLIYIAKYEAPNDDKDKTKTKKAKIAMASILYDAMGDAEHFSYSACGLKGFFNFTGLAGDGDGIELYEKKLQEEGKKFTDMVIKETGSTTLSIWYGSHEDLLHVENLYQTDECTRASAVDKALKESLKEKEKEEARSKELSMQMEILGAVSLFAGIVSTAITMGISVGFTGMFTAIGSVVGNLVLASGSIQAITGAMVGAALSGIFFVASMFLLLAFIVLLIITLVPHSTPDVEFTPIPKTMVDIDKAGNLVRYDAALDQDGNPSDLNKDSRGHWLALYYSKEKSAGSPVMALSGTDPGFTVKYGDMNVPDGQQPLTKFGGVNPLSLNAGQKKDETKGLYLYYTTYNSANSIKPANRKGKYISDLKIAVSRYEDTAREAVINSEGFMRLEVNLTPNSKQYCGTEYFTYIGYSTTDSAKDAVKDIRALYATDAYTLRFGDCDYINFMSKSDVSCPINTAKLDQYQSEQTPFCYQLYYTTSSKAGDPILADSLRVISNLSEVGYKEEYVRCFSGEAFDPQAEMGYIGCSVDVRDNQPIKDPEHHFLAYKDEKPYNYNAYNEYLAGISFLYGSRSYQVTYATVSRFGKARTFLEPDLLGREAGLFGVRLIKRNLTPFWGDDYSECNTYLGYSVTNNPKKAIYSLGVFVGEFGPDYHRQMAPNLNHSQIGFAASNIYKIDDRKITMRYSHAYISTSTDELPYPWGWMGDKTFQRSRAIYQAGPTSDPDYGPILTANIFWATSPKDLPLTESSNGNLTRLGGGRIETTLPANCRSLHAMFDKFHDVYDAKGQLLTPGTNLGFDHPEYDSSLYIYYYNSENLIERGTYVSKVEIVGDTSDYSSIERSLYYGIAYGDEIIGLDDPLGVGEKFAYHVSDSPIYDGDGNNYYDSFGYRGYLYNETAVYLAVSYSNRETDALGTVIVSTNPVGAELPKLKSVVMDKSGTKTNVSKGDFSCVAGYEYDALLSKQLWEPYRHVTFTVYSSKNGTPIGRLAIVRNDEIKIDLNRRGYRFLTDEYGEVFKPYSADKDGSRQKIVMVDAAAGNYIKSITAFNDMDTAEKWESLIKEGYQEMVPVDALGGLSTGRVHFAIKRTTSSLEALKNVLCSPNDHGAAFTYEDREYKKIGNINISDSVPLASQNVFLYETTGNKSDNSGSKPIYLALRNIGVMIEKDNSRFVYWNGISGDNVPVNADNTAVVTLEDGEMQTVTVLTTTNIEGSLGLLDGGAFERQDGYMKQYTKDQYETFRHSVTGSPKFVFTNLSGQKIENYGNKLTGSTTVQDVSGVAVVIMISVFAVAVGCVILVARKKRKKKEFAKN